MENNLSHILMNPLLTTIAQPFYDLGHKAAERLMKLINRKTKRTRVKVEKLPMQLVIRDLVGDLTRIMPREYAVLETGCID